MKDKKNLINLIVKGKSEPFCFLYVIQKEISEYCKNINIDFKTADYMNFKNMVDIIETNSDLNYNFLKILKEQNIIYKENEEIWDYKSNLEMLEETLTENHFKKLENKERENPLKELQNILKAYSLNQKQEDNSKLLPFITKYRNLDARLNFPLITAIERKRIEYYKTLLLEEDLTNNCLDWDFYFDNMDKDTDIVNHSLDDVNFCLKTYLLILSLKQFISNNNSKCIIFFTKNIIEEKIDFKNIIYENGKLFAYNKFEKIEINPEDYILQGLEEDITNYYYYPLKILLLRNESYKKFLKDGEKGFLYSLNLYEDFKNYFKNFIESQFFNQLLENVDEYKNIAILLKNEEFKEELLNETHLRFLPFYGSSTYFGYTNKDIMISFINSIPEITKYIRINKEKEIINVTNICLLFTIAVKFITALHEFIIHLTYSYLNFITKKKIDATSKKESIDEDDGGYFFERTLRGDTKFKFLNINNVVNLLDGSFEDNSFQFQNGLKCKFDYEKLISKIKEINGKKYGGFLKVFLSKYDIDFTFFEKFKAQSPTIFCRGKYDVGISMIRDIYDSYIYGGNKKSKK